MYMKDSGLMNKLYEDFLFDVTILENIRDRSIIKESEAIVLTYSHVEGAFSFALVGYSISCVVFLLEFITHRIIKWQIRRLSKFRTKKFLMAKKIEGNKRANHTRVK